VNIIEQPYLRFSVDVLIIGEVTQFPLRLRNTLTNLCKHVTVYSTQEVSDRKHEDNLL
jgi:hypothetical protein